MCPIFFGQSKIGDVYRGLDKVGEGFFGSTRVFNSSPFRLINVPAALYSNGGFDLGNNRRLYPTANGVATTIVIYDAITNTFLSQTVPSANYSRVGFRFGTRIFFESNVLTSVVEYNTANDVFTARTIPANPGQFNSAFATAMQVGNNVLFMSNSAAANAVTSILMYYGSSNSFALRTGLPSARYCDRATVTQNHNRMVIPTNAIDRATSCVVYNANTDVFSNRTGLTNANYWFGVTTTNHTLFPVGFSANQNTNVISFNNSTDAFTNRTGLANARWADMIGMGNNFIVAPTFVSGGTTNMAVYDGNANTFANRTGLPSGMWGSARGWWNSRFTALISSQWGASDPATSLLLFNNSNGSATSRTGLASSTYGNNILRNSHPDRDPLFMPTGWSAVKNLVRYNVASDNFTTIGTIPSGNSLVIHVVGNIVLFLEGSDTITSMRRHAIGSGSMVANTLLNGFAMGNGLNVLGLAFFPMTTTQLSNSVALYNSALDSVERHERLPSANYGQGHAISNSRALFSTASNTQIVIYARN